MRSVTFDKEITQQISQTQVILN